MKIHTRHTLVLGTLLAVTSSVCAQSNTQVTINNVIILNQPKSALHRMLTSFVDEGQRLVVIGRIKAIYADRKDICGGRIRVKYDGNTLQLAGFVANAVEAAEAEKLAIAIAKPQQIETFWSICGNMPSETEYQTYLGQQVEDATLYTRIYSSLHAPAVRDRMKDKVEILAIDIHRGAVRLFIVKDRVSNFDPTPYVRPISGVTSLNIYVIETFKHRKSN